MTGPADTPPSPLIRSPMLDRAVEALTSWSQTVANQGLIGGAWLFGSAVNDDGLRFDAESSDLDVIVEVPWDSLGVSGRVTALHHLRDAKIDLEQTLLKILHRASADDQIVSLVPVTAWERALAVHKDGNSAILTETPAIDLLSGSRLARLAEASYTVLAPPHRDLAQRVQKTRAGFLTIGANGRVRFAIAAHADPVPKELIRSFAVATADPGMPAAQTADLARGLRELTLAVAAGASDDRAMHAYGVWLGVRQGARGKVAPVISVPNYLATIEMIFDRVTRQYPAMTVLPADPPPSATPTAAPAPVTRPAPLPAEFVVSLKDTLGGRVADNLRAIAAARENLRAGLTPAFSLRFAEHPRADMLLSTNDRDLSDADHALKLKVFARRTRFQARQARLTDGIELILYHGANLFPDHGDKSLFRLLARSIDAWIAHAATGLVNIGGGIEAWHPGFYPDEPLAFSFSDLPRTGGQLLTGEPPTRPWEGDVHGNFSPDVLAGGFVPELVSIWLHRRDRLSHLTPDDRQVAFMIDRWRYGPR
ncbi:hypothetical protein P7L64_06160 [Tistrella bauzanensis]